MDSSLAEFLEPKQKARLEALAAQRGSTPADLARELLDRALDYEEWFLAQVEVGIKEADQGMLVEHADVVRAIEQRLRKK